MTKILICGGKGQLGADCNRVLGADHRILSHDLDTLDIADPAAVREVVRDFRPDVLVNCAAYTRVDDCETRQALAAAVNGLAPGILARAMEETGGRIIHVSTDYVFDGRKPLGESYVESDPPCPASVYGRTKRDGEDAVRGETDRFAILRTAWLYGATGHNFLKTMLRLALADPERQLTVVDDQHGSPTWSWRLAQQIRRLVAAGGRGIFHATAEGSATWYALARRFLERMAVPHRIAPCATSAYPTPAVRPQNAVLENRRLKAAGINEMKDWREDLDRFVDRHGPDLLREVQGETRL
jgi:dTDP-4-dehydrorhamnose reductase